MWGQGVRRLAKRHSCRIIPTRVGTSFFKYQRRFQLQDHPHACGDKICDAVITQFFIGSSPRVWGQALPDLVGSKTDGIIPTRVGTSVFLLPFGLSLWDHPHACGDKDINKLCTVGADGSSPRVWGQEKVIYIVTDSNRIIPTRVGTSFNNMLISGEARDHPHACGDKILQ